MRFMKRLIDFLFGQGKGLEAPPRNCDISFAALRIASNELLDGFGSFAEQCWVEAKTDQLKELQLLAEWLCKELKKSVGFPPETN